MTLTTAVNLYDLTHKTVRDLAWCLFSPSVITSCEAYPIASVPDDAFLKEIELLWPWLLELDANPKPLHEYITSRFSRRLGLYFENLISFFLETHPKFDVIVEHQPIIRDKQTLGELDIVFSVGQRVYHWELAVKYYMKAKGESGLASYIGPAAKDRLDLKLSHLAQHQLPMMQTPEAIKAVGKRDVASMAFIKGMLFTHIDETIPTEYESPISLNHRQGRWAHIDEWLERRYDSRSRFLILPRLEWLAPVSVDATKTASLLNWDTLNAELFDYFNATPVATCVIELVETDSMWIQQHKFFVLPNEWPHFPND